MSNRRRKSEYFGDEDIFGRRFGKDELVVYSYSDEMKYEIGMGLFAPLLSHFQFKFRRNGRELGTLSVGRFNLGFHWIWNFPVAMEGTGLHSSLPLRTLRVESLNYFQSHSPASTQARAPPGL